MLLKQLKQWLIFITSLGAIATTLATSPVEDPVEPAECLPVGHRDREDGCDIIESIEIPNYVARFSIVWPLPEERSWSRLSLNEIRDEIINMNALNTRELLIRTLRADVDVQCETLSSAEKPSFLLNEKLFGPITRWDIQEGSQVPLEVSFGERSCQIFHLSATGATPSLLIINRERENKTFPALGVSKDELEAGAVILEDDHFELLEIDSDINSIEEREEEDKEEYETLSDWHVNLETLSAETDSCPSAIRAGLDWSLSQPIIQGQLISVQRGVDGCHVLEIQLTPSNEDTKRSLLCLPWEALEELSLSVERLGPHSIKITPENTKESERLAIDINIPPEDMNSEEVEGESQDIMFSLRLLRGIYSIDQSTEFGLQPLSSCGLLERVCDQWAIALGFFIPELELTLPTPLKIPHQERSEDEGEEREHVENWILRAERRVTYDRGCEALESLNTQTSSTQSDYIETLTLIKRREER